MRVIEQYLLLVTIYAVLGWTIEVIRVYISERKFINRGFLVGPYCLIYGFGALLITLLLSDISSVILLFLSSVVLCGFLEYLTSYVMEKIFKTRWWDYSNNKFNLNGRICLECLIYFGIAGLLVINVTNPIILKYIGLISDLWLNVISIILIFNYLCDFKLSFEVAINLKKLSVNSDSTEEVSKAAREMIIKKFKRYNRLLNAFPSIRKQIKINLKK